MNVKVDFDNIVVKEDKTDTIVKILMLKGEKGDSGATKTSELTNDSGFITNQANDLINYYKKSETYTKSETNNLLDGKLNTSALDNYYEISEVDTLLEGVNTLVGKKPYYFNNIAEMKAYDLQNGDYAITKGYYSANDGGQGQYIVVNDNELQEDNGSVHTLINGLKAKLLIGKEVNVKQFGAKGDGNTNDATFIQSCINYCELNNSSVYIPAGNYLINATLNVTGCPISGNSSSNTKIIMNNCDGFLLKQYNSQKICVIQNLAFISLTPNVEIAGITYQKYTNGSSTRSRGYKLTNLYFENLGCAIEIQDAFRNTISDIGIINCFRALYIKNQVVQSSFNNIIANNDLDANTTSSRFGETINNQLSIGVEIGLKGETERPEGIKFNQVCCTNYNIGCVHRDSLYFHASQCEFDLSHEQALYVSGGQGGTTFDGCWFANKSSSTKPIVDIATASTTDKSTREIINCSVFNNSTQADVIGIALGVTYPYGWNFNIKNCNISNATNCQLKYGIRANRIRDLTIASNNVYGCETGIKIDTDGKTQIINNKVEKIDVTAYAGTTVYALNNIYTTKNIVMAGTLIGNFD